MDERERNIFDAFAAMREFNTQNSADYQTLPDAVANFNIIKSVIERLETHAATKTSGARGQAVQRKAALAAAIKRKMKEISRTARALDIDDEGFRRLFRVPDGNSEAKLLAAAREFAAEAVEHKEDFLRLAMSGTFVDDLNEDIAAFEQAANQKAGAQSKGAGATAGIDDEIERGMRSANILNAMVQNIYRNDPVKLAAWTKARHIKRIGRGSSGGNTPPTT